MGKRDLKQMIKKEIILSDGQKKIWSIPEFEEKIKYLTFKEVNQRIISFSNGLIECCGLKKKR